MRTFLLLCVLLLLGGGAAFGQEQERKLAERVMRPNMNLSYNLEKSTFSGSGSKKVLSKNAQVKEFNFDQRYTPKAFSPRTFLGLKKSGIGQLQYETAAASTKGKYEIPNAAKKTDTKTVPVNESREAQKTMAVRESADASRGFFGRGRSQDRFDAEKGSPNSNHPIGYTGDMKPMTIDDIRTLLNKNK